MACTRSRPTHEPIHYSLYASRGWADRRRRGVDLSTAGTDLGRRSVASLCIYVDEEEMTKGFWRDLAKEFRDYMGSTVSFPADYFAGWFGVAPSERGPKS